MSTVADAGAGLPIATYHYLGPYRVVVRAYPQNGSRMTYLDDVGSTDVGYDGLRRPVELRHVRDDNTLMVGFTHTYDRMNNKLGEAKLHDTSNSEIYGYDSAYRLIDFDRPNSDAIDALHGNWRLDGVGNWRQVTSTESGLAVAETREHSPVNELVRREDSIPIVMSFDDNGNQIDNGTQTFAWDFRNRLVTVTRNSDGTTVANYSYDAWGRRIRKEIMPSGTSDGTSYFYHDGWRELEERDAGGAVAQQFVYGIYIDEPLVLDRNLDGDNSAISAGDQRLFYHQSTLYSTFAITDVTATIVEAYQYDAYGRQTVIRPGDNGQLDFGDDDDVMPDSGSDVSNPFLFTGRRLDEETNLYFYRARYMNTKEGRFLQRDGGRDEGTVNLYEYTLGNPTGFLDPLGLQAKTWVWRKNAWQDGYHFMDFVITVPYACKDGTKAWHGPQTITYNLRHQPDQGTAGVALVIGVGVTAP